MNRPSESRRDIENLIATYAFLEDDGGFDGMGALLNLCAFTFGNGPIIRGKAAMGSCETRFEYVNEDGTPCIRHLTHHPRL